MTLYGDPEKVQTLLRPNETTSYGADITTRLADVQKAVSLRLEQELGWDRLSNIVTVRGGYGDLIRLPYPARSISTVTVGATNIGGVVTGGEVYASDVWRAYPLDCENRILGLQLRSGGSWGVSSSLNTAMTSIVIEGDFGVLADPDEMPDDITYAANLLILRTFQRENTGVAGVSGEDGSFKPPLDPWKEPFVKGVIERYRVKRVRAV